MLLKHDFFAAANTSDGFIGFFDKYFDPAALGRLYVIKGGPGTGKSTVMRRIGAAAERTGRAVTYFYCSSDPGSLDGILIPELSFGMIDGTAPHTADPVYPGAADVLLDLYPFFDVPALRRRREEIITLTDKNKALHKRSSRMRGFAGAAEREAASAVSGCVDHKKMAAAVKRIAAGVKAEPGAPRLGQISAFSVKGKDRLDTFRSGAEYNVGISDGHGAGYLFLNCLRDELIREGKSFYYSIDTLLPQRCEAIFLPGSGVFFSLCGKAEKAEYDKFVNTDRFVAADALKDARTGIRICRKVRDSFEDEAERLIREAGRVHGELEAIYNTAVDFDGVRAAADEIIGRDIVKS